MHKSLSNKVSTIGEVMAIATPYHLSTYFGLQAYLASGRIADGALAGILSLTVNLPHLCGLEGDCIIMVMNSYGALRAYNGTGRTGSGHVIERFIRNKKSEISLRGWESAMVYGAPMALSRYSSDESIDVSRVIFGLGTDIKKGIPSSHTLNYYKRYYARDLRKNKLSHKWQAFLTDYDRTLIRNMTSPATSIFNHIASEGFQTMYKGTVGEVCSRHFMAGSNGLFTEADLYEFSPPDSNVFHLEVFGANIHMVGYNTPWLELSVLLKIIAFLDSSDRFDLSDVDSAYQLCHAASLIDAVVSRSKIRRTAFANEIEQSTAVLELCEKVIELLPSGNLGPITSKGSDTVFMGAVTSEGTIIGITSSIFTPFGSLIDPGDIGLLLSNRAFSFSLKPDQWNSLLPREPAPHTANVIIVECSSQNFTIGATGGPVQFQILAQLLYRMIVLGEDAQAALEAPRFANLGQAGGEQNVVLFAEQRTGFEDPRFVIGQDLSPRLGVAQIAGVDKASGRCYGAADPRGEGVALAI